MALDHQISLDRLYEMIDDLRAELASHQSDHQAGDEKKGVYPDDYVSFNEAPILWSILSDLMGGWTAYGSELPKAIGVRADILNKFGKQMKHIPRRQALHIGDRTLSYLRSIEGQIAASVTRDSKGRSQIVDQPKPPEFASPSPLPPKSVVEVKGTLWKAVPNDVTIKGNIVRLSILLDQIVTLAKGSNLPAAAAALSPIDRAQLIAILETALKLLKAPLVEKSLFEKAKSMLAKTARKVAEKETEEAMGELANQAQDVLGDVIGQIF